MKTSATPPHRVAGEEFALATEVVLDRFGLSKRDTFLVVCNPETVEIATALADAARTRTDDVRINEFLPTSRDGEEPPTAVATAMREASAIAILTRHSLSHTKARMVATQVGAPGRLKRSPVAT